MNKLSFTRLILLAGIASRLFAAIPQTPDSTIVDSAAVDLSDFHVDSSQIEQESIPSIQHIDPGKGFSFILSDAKELFAEALIADQHDDTSEVIYLIDKIVTLLNQAEQLGEMLPDDQEEFGRFETTLLYS